MCGGARWRDSSSGPQVLWQRAIENEGEAVLPEWEQPAALQASSIVDAHVSLLKPATGNLFFEGLVAHF